MGATKIPGPMCSCNVFLKGGSLLEEVSGIFRVEVGTGAIPIASEQCHDCEQDDGPDGDADHDLYDTKLARP